LQRSTTPPALPSVWYLAADPGVASEPARNHRGIRSRWSGRPNRSPVREVYPAERWRSFVRRPVAKAAADPTGPSRPTVSRWESEGTCSAFHKLALMKRPTWRPGGAHRVVVADYSSRSTLTTSWRRGPFGGPPVDCGVAVRRRGFLCGRAVWRPPAPAVTLRHLPWPEWRRRRGWPGLQSFAAGPELPCGAFEGSRLAPPGQASRWSSRLRRGAGDLRAGPEDASWSRPSMCITGGNYTVRRDGIGGDDGVRPCLSPIILDRCGPGVRLSEEDSRFMDGRPCRADDAAAGPPADAHRARNCPRRLSHSPPGSCLTRKHL